MASRVRCRVNTEYDTPFGVRHRRPPGLGAAARLPTPRAIATRPVRTISSTPYGTQHVEQAVDLGLRRRHLDHQRRRRHVDDARAEDLGQLHDRGAAARGRR